MNQKVKGLLPWIATAFFALLSVDYIKAGTGWGVLFLIPAALFCPPIKARLPSRASNKLVKICAVILAFIVSSATMPPSASSTVLDNTQTSSGAQSATNYLSQSTSASAESQFSNPEVTPSSTPAVSAVAAKTPQSGAKLKVHYLDVGQGDSEFIELPNGQTMLIDAGVPEKGSSVVSYIQSLGHKQIDYLIATHPHADHIGGMTAVVNSFDVGAIYMPRTSSADTQTTKVYTNLLSAIKSKGYGVHTAKAGVSVFDIENLSAKLIAPNGTNYGDLNQYSAVMMLQYGDNKFLFTGDAGNTSENEITADVKADVLKVGHHGSKTATGQEFLNKVHPKYAVIEVGAGNKYGHPTAQTLNRLQSVGATVYRTDKDGTIVFTSDSHTITVNKKSSSVQQQAPPAAAKKPASKANKSTPSKSTAPAPNNKGVTVYVTDKGKKYHRDGCRYLKKSQIAISLSEAKAEGYTPCSVCNPPE